MLEFKSELRNEGLWLIWLAVINAISSFRIEQSNQVTETFYAFPGRYAIIKAGHDLLLCEINVKIITNSDYTGPLGGWRIMYPANCETSAECRGHNRETMCLFRVSWNPVFFFQFQILRFLIMADVQKEYGYTAQANSYIEALAKIRIPGESNQCLLVIQRKTWGWNKKSDQISLSQFVDGTGICKPHVCRALMALQKMNMIIVTKKGNGITEYAIQKDFEKWNPLPKRVISVTKKGNVSKNTDISILNGKTLPKKVMVEPLPKKVIEITKKGNGENVGKITNNADTIEKEAKIPPIRALPKKVHTKDIRIKPSITKPSRGEKKIENIIPPLLEWVEMYLQEKGITGDNEKEEAEKFIDHYTNTNWRIGGSRNKMVDWKAAVRNWIKNYKKWTRGSSKNQTEAKPGQDIDPPPNSEKRRINWLKMINEHLGKELSVYIKNDLPKIKKKLDVPTYERILLILKESKEVKHEQ